MIRRFALLLLFTASLAATAHAAEDRVSFLNNITIQPGEEIGDAVCFLCSIRNDGGTVHGDAVAFLGSIKTSGNIEGDLVSFLGGADLAEGVTVNGDCVVFGGNIVRHGNARINGSQVMFPFILFLIPLFFLVAIIWGIRALVMRSRSAYAMPPPR